MANPGAVKNDRNRAPNLLSSGPIASQFRGNSMDREVSVGAALKGAGDSGDTQVLKSVCRSCHGGCSALMHVKDGELVKVEGDPEGPLKPRQALSDRRSDNRARLSPRPPDIPPTPGRPARIGQVGAHFLGRGARRDFREDSRDPGGIRARIDCHGHRHGPSSHPLGLQVWPRARHAQLVRAGLRPVFPSPGQYLYPDHGRSARLRFHGRCGSRAHHVLGP